MASPLYAEVSPDVLAEHVGQVISIVRMPLPVAARLHLGGDRQHPLLLLDPSAPPEDLVRALLDALALVTVGPGAAPSARKVRHLRLV
jgi:hypothetical protein